MADPILPRRDFYVYALFREDGCTPFYIGKGCGTRLNDHEYYSATDKTYKGRIIRKMQRAGASVPKAKLVEGLTDDDAKQIEMDLIRLIGRRPHGPLANLTDGGDGVTNLPVESRKRMGPPRGVPRSPEVKAKLRAANLGKKHSVETREKIGAISRAMSPESRAKIAAANRNMSAATRAKIGAASRGRITSDETREKQRAAQTPERRAKAAAVRAAANKTRVYTPEMRARLSEIAKNRSQQWHERQAAAKRGRKASPETRAKLSAIRKGRKLSPEQIAKTAAANRGKKRSEEARANIRAGILASGRYWK